MDGSDAAKCAAATSTTAGAAEPLLALPAMANAHDHARTVRTSSIGAAGRPTWMLEKSALIVPKSPASIVRRVWARSSELVGLPS